MSSSTAMPPSSVAHPTKVDTPAQQASTQPGNGSDVHNTDKVPFKEQVIGVAQVTRGTVLGKPDLKAHGEMILEGQTTHEEDRRKDH